MGFVLGSLVNRSSSHCKILGLYIDSLSLLLYDRPLFGSFFQERKLFSPPPPSQLPNPSSWPQTTSQFSLTLKIQTTINTQVCLAY